MSSFREQEIGRRLLEQWKADVPFSQMVEETGFRVQKIRTLIGEAAGGANEWRKMREARRAQRSGGAVIIQQENGLDLNLVRSVAQETVEGIFDSDTLREMVMDEVKKFPPQTGKLEVTIAKSDIKVTIKHSHGALKETLRRVGAGFNNVLLVGPAGSGKTTLSNQLSECLKRGFGFISLSGGTTEGQLLGRLTSDGRYLPSLFVEMYEKGGVFLLDEVDAGDPNVLLVLNSALANGDLSVPARVKKPFAKRHADFVLICAANTWGTGADFQYVGRNQLDAAFLSRFAGAIIEVGYDEGLERSLTLESWYVVFVRVRQAAVQARLRRVLGTREMLAGQKLLKAGYSEQETWAALTAGWTPDEISKARVVA